MSKAYKTEQEGFWAGGFGKEYINRNALDADSFAAYVFLWSQVIRGMATCPASILELGCNIGINLHALRTLLPKAALSGLEINSAAAEVVRNWGQAEVIEQSMLEYTPKKKWDLVFTSGVLIHINPVELEKVYSLIDKASARYVCMIEYYNPTPVSIPYHGETDKLFKRDFAGNFMDAFPGYALCDYGFVYHRSWTYPVDDLTWFVLERKA